MNYYFLVAGIIFFIIAISLYLYFCIVKLRQTPDLGDGVSLFLSCNGVSAGTKVAYLGLIAQSGTSLADDRTYILLGGLAVIWVSFQSILKTIILPSRAQKLSAITNVYNGSSISEFGNVPVRKNEP